MLCSVTTWSQAHKCFATRACNERPSDSRKPSMAVEIFFLLVSKLWKSRADCTGAIQRAVRGPRAFQSPVQQPQ